MSSSVNIPDTYFLHFRDGIRITPDPMTVNSTLAGDANRPVAALLMGDANKPITATLQGNSQRPLATTLDLLNLPHLTLDQIKDLMTPKLRVQVPNYEQICFKILGLELFSICLSGEIQMITQPYQPNAFERCEIECCPEDTRPFPEKTDTHDPIRIEVPAAEQPS